MPAVGASIRRRRSVAAAATAVLLAALTMSPSPSLAPPVSTCGTALCVQGMQWSLAMGTVYLGLTDPRAAVGRVAALGLNTVRITDFLDVDGDPAAAPFDETRWRAVDRLIDAAGDAGLYVVLDFSTYRNLLKRAGGNPYTADWLPFLRFVSDRVNTATGRRYAVEPTIAMISFAGEVDGITGGDNTYGLTSDQLTSFYRTVEEFWHSVAPAQLLTAGGLSHLDWDPGIDWRKIFSLPFNDVNAVHVYTAGDRAGTVPAVAEFSRATGKPWIIEEFGYPASMPDADRADRFREMYDRAAANQAAGIGLWNVGAQTVDTYDVGPQFPLTAAVVRARAPG